MRSPTLLALTLALGAPLPSFGQKPDHAGWFPWPTEEPLAQSALNLSELNHRPAGARGQVTVKDGVFKTADGQRIRFWGCNISAAEAFPDAEGADRLARRLAAGGLNIARLHHLDNPWGQATGGSIFSPNDNKRLDIDAAQLDKLHRLVAALKREGIYSNINLKVSRTHTAADGFPESIAQAPAFQKRLDYFQRRIVDLQKTYAKQLLTVKNPYTGLSLAEDPAVAMVEINNENALTGLRSRDVGRGLELLPEPFRGELVALWSSWLAKKYPSDEALAAAWAKDATALGEVPFSPASRWHADAQPGNIVRVHSDSVSNLHLQVGPGDGVRWRSAAFVDQLNLRENQTYTLEYSIRADKERLVQVAVGRDDPLWRTDKWRTRGLNSIVKLNTEWSTQRHTFTVHSVVDVGSRLSIIAGHTPGEVWIKDLRLVSGSETAGLRPGQSAKAGTVPIPTDPTPAQWTDWLDFLVDTEKSYVAEMREYLLKECQVRAPIVNTQANYGGISGLMREQESDFIDSHCYWQHPDFAGDNGTWDTAHWTINNTPQLGEFGPRWFGELGGIAQLRVKGKPFTVTEVDHPAPSEYAVEMYPVLSSFASLQDWDGIFPFDSVGQAKPNYNDPIGTFFDQAHHPAKWAFSAFATKVFRQNLVPAAPSERELQIRGPFWEEANHLDVLWLKHQPGQDLGFLTDRLYVNEKLLPSSEKTRIVRKGDSKPSAITLKRTDKGPLYLVDAPQAAAIVGFFGGTDATAGSLALTSGTFGRNFGAVTVVTLDDAPIANSKRSLITVAARGENASMVWNEARTSTGDSWSVGPTLAEPVPAEVRLKTGGPRTVYALKPNGERGAEVPAQVRDGWLVFSTKEGPRTLHYEVVQR